MRKSREEAGILQSALAKAAGFHRSLMYEVESGKRHAFTVSRTGRLAALIGDTANAVRLMALSAAERGIDAKALQECSHDALEALVELVLLLPSLPASKIAALRKVLGSLQE